MASGFVLTFEVADKSSFDAVMNSLSNRLSPQGLEHFLYNVVDPFIRNRVEGRFSSEGDEVSGSWHPLAVVTQQIRASHGFPPDHPINVRTGDMRDFLVHSKSDVKISGTTATLMHPPPPTNPEIVEKIQTAQLGKSSPYTVPRPVVGLGYNDLLFITSELAVYLAEDFL